MYLFNYKSLMKRDLIISFLIKNRMNWNLTLGFNPKVGNEKYHQIVWDDSELLWFQIFDSCYYKWKHVGFHKNEKQKKKIN